MSRHQLPRGGGERIALASSEEKRALLRNLGVDLVCNSRSLAFAEEIQSFLEPILRDGRGTWIADYVRLRFTARKPE